MDLGAVMILLSLGFAILACILSILELVFIRRGITSHSEKLPFLAKMSSIILFITVTGALVLLYIYFITSNMDIKYVWEHSSTSLPLEYKISGTLAGMAGSLLFWVWCIVFSWFIEELNDVIKPKSKVLMGCIRAIIMLISAIFLYFLFIRDIFGRTPAADLSLQPNGEGLNPLLQTPLMVVHPPLYAV